MTSTMQTTTSNGAYHSQLTLTVRKEFLKRQYRYSTEPFASANGQIPQLNLWDDHDVGIP